MRLAEGKAEMKDKSTQRVYTLCQGESGLDQESTSVQIRSPDSESGCGVQTRTVDPDDFQDLLGTSLSNGTSVVKFS